jgi:hypothetical protein
MKRHLLNAILAIALAVTVAAVGDSDSEISTTPTASMAVERIRIDPLTFTLKGEHLLAIYYLGPGGKVIDRIDLTLTPKQSTDWLEATNSRAWLKDWVLRKSTLEVNTKVAAVTNVVTITNYVTVTNAFAKP